MSGNGFELVGGETKFDGKLAKVRVERFRHADGEEVEREIVRHMGAVGIVARDEKHVWLVRQPREATGDPALLEIPAGKLDEEGEEPLDAAKRELAEEIGKAAKEWRLLSRFYSSPGFTDEEVWVYEATGLSDAQDAEADDSERIEVIPWALDDIDGAIAGCHDSKSLIGLLWLRSAIGGDEPPAHAD